MSHDSKCRELADAFLADYTTEAAKDRVEDLSEAIQEAIEVALDDGTEPRLCPQCRRIMSHREFAEQRICNDCQ
jgi:Mn-dependent DtxR family transcriptional regulator